LNLRPDPENAEKKVPYLEDRQTLGHWAKKQIDNKTMNDYRATFNSRSLDGLPGLRVARKDKGELLLLRDIEAQVLKRNGVQIVLVALLSSVVTAVVVLFLTGHTSLPDITNNLRSKIGIQ
jgi:hypothetical protein